jgi:hypothetical protein
MIFTIEAILMHTLNYGDRNVLAVDAPPEGGL